jgi:hypothetical protein
MPMMQMSSGFCPKYSNRSLFIYSRSLFIYGRSPFRCPLLSVREARLRRAKIKRRVLHPIPGLLYSAHWPKCSSSSRYARHSRSLFIYGSSLFIYSGSLSWLLLMQMSAVFCPKYILFSVPNTYCFLSQIHTVFCPKYILFSVPNTYCFLSQIQEQPVAALFGPQVQRCVCVCARARVCGGAVGMPCVT